VRKLLIVVATILALSFGLSACSPDVGTPSGTSASDSAPGSSAKAEPSTTSKPKASKPKADTAQPDETVSQKQARLAAQEYLDSSAFSRSGLIEQLKFEGYSTQDAKYGVDATSTNWDKQAVRSAKEYLDVSAFSRKGLIDQLKFDGFTQEQATHGADEVGL
jgi:hypothetical protein